MHNILCGANPRTGSNRFFVQFSSCETLASDRVRARQIYVPDDRSLSQRVVLFPRLHHAQHGPAHWQAVLEQPTDGLVRHCQVRHESGTQPSCTILYINYHRRLTARIIEDKIGFNMRMLAHVLFMGCLLDFHAHRFYVFLVLISSLLDLSSFRAGCLHRIGLLNCLSN